LCMHSQFEYICAILVYMAVYVCANCEFGVYFVWLIVGFESDFICLFPAGFFGHFCFGGRKNHLHLNELCVGSDEVGKPPRGGFLIHFERYSV
jgi:hypothetical protein